MIALCGSCMSRVRASTRWTKQLASALTRLQGLVCDGCGRACMSEKFRHAAFCATKADLAAAEKDVAAA